MFLMIAILRISAKLATSGLLSITVFWNKDYDVMISFHEFIKNILSSVWNHIVDMVMWPKFGNYSVFMTEVIIRSDLKTDLFGEMSWFKLNNLGLILGMTLKYWSRVPKRFKLKSKSLRAKCKVWKSYREKLVRG